MTSSTPTTTTDRTALAAACDHLEELIRGYTLDGVPEDVYADALEAVVDALAAVDVPPFLAAAALDVIAVDARAGRVHVWVRRSEVGRALDAAQAPLDAAAVREQDELVVAVEAEISSTHAEIAAATSAGRFEELPALRRHVEIDLVAKAAEVGLPGAHRQIVIAQWVVDANARRLARAEEVQAGAEAEAEETQRQADAAKEVAAAARREAAACREEGGKREQLLLQAANDFSAAAGGLPTVEALRQQYAAAIR